MLEVYVDGDLLGQTSASTHGGGCGYEPTDCLGDAASSSGSWLIGAGAHDLSIVPVFTQYRGGAGYFKLVAVPEPSSLVLLFLGAIVAGAMGRRVPRRRRE